MGGTEDGDLIELGGYTCILLKVGIGIYEVGPGLGERGWRDKKKLGGDCMNLSDDLRMLEVGRSLSEKHAHWPR